MKETQYNTTSKEETLEKLGSILKEVNHNKVAIMAGHFALVADKKNKALIPAIHQEIVDKGLAEEIKGHPYMGDFPFQTWTAGVSLLKSLLIGNKEVKLSILTNDWQWVPAVESGQENDMRQSFFKNEVLPNKFSEILDNENLLAEKVMIPFKSNDGKKTISPYFFSENGLRQRYKNHFKSICDLGANKCAQEFVPFLSLLAKEGYDTVISFVPRSCYGAIEEGSQAALTQAKLPLNIINIYTDGIYQKDFWEDTDISVFK